MRRDPRQGGNRVDPGAQAAAATLFQNAVQAFQAGRLPEAEYACRQILDIFPSGPPALHLLGLIAARTGHLNDAKTLIGRALAQSQRDPDIHNSLGGVLFELGEHPAALRAFDAALRLRDAYPDAHSNRARVLVALERFDEAAASARKALALRPDFFDAWIHLGNALMRAGRLHDARDAFNRAAALHPDHPGPHMNLGRVAVLLDDQETAVAAYRRVIAADPRSLEAHLELGDALNGAGRLTEAQAAFQAALSGTPENRQAVLGLADIELQLGHADKAFALLNQALARDPAAPAVHIGLGFAYFTTGQHDAAAEALTQALKHDPESAKALALLMEVREPASGDPLVARAEALVGDTKAGDAAERTMLRFALGRAYLKGGDGDRAFHHLGQANREERARIAFDIATAEQYFDAIADHATPDLFRCPAIGATSGRPVFVLGMPRSGTTLIEQILASHPDVWGAGELTAAGRLVKALPPPGYPAIMDAGDPDPITRFGETYLAETETIAPGRARVVDKMPGNFIYAGLIAQALPQARIIHCQRDAVDTCLSCYAITFSGDQPYAYDLAELGRYWRAYDRLMAHWRKVLPADRFIEVRYEDVVADLEGQARRLVDAIGLPWNDACLAFHKTDRVVRTASVGQVRQPIYTQSVGRWARHARHLQPLLDALGVAAPA